MQHIDHYLYAGFVLKLSSYFALYVLHRTKTTPIIVTHSSIFIFFLSQMKPAFRPKIVSEYDQEIPQS